MSYERSILFTDTDFHSQTAETVSILWSDRLETSTLFRVYYNPYNSYDIKNGNMYIKGALISPVFENLSDKRLKTNITDVSETDSEFLLKLKPKYYEFIDKPNKIQAGFLAQDIQSLNPKMVNETTEGFLSVEYNQFIPHIIQLIQKLHNEQMLLKQQKCPFSFFKTQLTNCFSHVRSYMRHLLSTLYVLIKTGKEV